MKSKYLNVEDVKKVLDQELDHIDFLGNEMALCHKRIEYLNILKIFLNEEALCPIVDKKIVDSDIKLQEFISPMLCKMDSRYYHFDFNYKGIKDYGVNPDTIDKLLHDFVNFVVDYRGQKIGIGDFLIRKFIYERCGHYGHEE